jgi:hypothetical protein
MEVQLFESAFSVFNSVCVSDMMINNRGTSRIRRPLAPSPPSPLLLLPTRRSSARPLELALEASAIVFSFESLLSSDDRYLNMERQRRKLSGSQNRERKIGKEKECAGMKESFSKWLKDSRFYVSVSRRGL